MRELKSQRPIEILVGVGLLGIPWVVGLVWILVVSWRGPYAFLLLIMFALPVFFTLGRILEKDREARGIAAFFCIFAIALLLFAIIAPPFLQDHSVENMLSKLPTDGVAEIDLQTLQSMENNFPGVDWVDLGVLLWLATGVLALYLPRSNLWFNDAGGS